MNLESAKILLLLFLGTFLFSCGDMEYGNGPGDLQLLLKSETKWEADVITNQKIRKVSYKEYDKSGNIIVLQVFNDNGSLALDTKISFVENTKVEHVTSYDKNGIALDSYKCTYESNNDNKTSTKTTYDDEGKEIGRQVTNFDERGNAIRTVKFNSDGSVAGETKFKYSYNANGQVVNVQTYENGSSITITNDSLVYHLEDRKIERVRIDDNGMVLSVITINYNLNGTIVDEVMLSPIGEATRKFTYEYTYY